MYTGGIETMNRSLLTHGSKPLIAAIQRQLASRFLGINPSFVSLRKSENSISIANYVNDPSSGGTIQPVTDCFMCDRFVLAHL